MPPKQHSTRRPNKGSYSSRNSIPQVPPPAGTAPVQAAECRYCRSEVHPKASRCPKCQAYLGWFGRISNWATGLNAISLLLTVGALSFPIYQKVLAPQRAELDVTVLKAEGKTFDFMVANSGNRPATIISAALQSEFKYDGKPIRQTTRLDETFKTVLLEPEKVYRFSADVMSGLAPMQPNPGLEIDAPDILKQFKSCQLEIIYVDFGTKQKRLEQAYPCFVPDLTSNSDGPSKALLSSSAKLEQ